MNIQKYTKNEDNRTDIQFREPTVRDCCQFSGLNPNLEEKATTDYLDHMQEDKGKADMSINWTVYDRRTALYWIYLLSRDDTTILQKYDCAHCGKEHQVPLELADLGQYMEEASRSMKEPFELNAKKGNIVPLRGYAMEHLERLKNYRDSQGIDSDEYKNADYECFLYRVAYSVVFDDEDETQTQEQRADKRVEDFLSLSSKVFKPFVVKVRVVADEMRHGLSCEIRDGEVVLNTTPHECPNKEGALTRLMLPFHAYEYFPSF